MKRRWIAGLLAVVLAASGMGCAATGETSEESADFTPQLDTEENVTVNIVGNMQNFEALEAVITDFGTYYPNCEVIYEPMTEGGDYWTVLKARLISDDSVGIFMMDEGHYEEDDMKEMCANLLEADIDFSAVREDVLSSVTVDGKMFEMPLMRNTFGLIVNETLLAEEGLSVPTNYSEFLTACETLKQAGYTPVQGYSGMVNDNLMRSMSYVIMNNSFESMEDENMAALLAGEEGSAALFQPIFDVLDTLYQNGYIDRAVNETYEDNYNASILKFFEGDVPFLVGSTETFSGMKKRESKSEHFSEEPFEYAYMSTPLGEDGSYCYIQNWYGFAVNENCSQKEWAVEFMRFLATKEELNQIAYVKGLPSVAAETEDDRFIGLDSEQEEYSCTTDTFISENVRLALYAVEKDFVNGEITVDEATAEIERRLREGDFE